MRQKSAYCGYEMDNVVLLRVFNIVRRFRRRLRIYGIFRTRSGMLRERNRIPCLALAYGRMRALAAFLADRVQTDEVFIVEEQFYKIFSKTNFVNGTSSIKSAGRKITWLNLA